jgi:hypothetical protein
MRIENYDYSYELTDEQLLHYSALPAIAKLRWLDEARRFTLLARRARAAEENQGQSPISEIQNRGQTPSEKTGV